MTQKERMLSGMLYDPGDPELVELREQAHRLARAFNDADEARRPEILARLAGACGAGTVLMAPVQFDYGRFTRFGERCFANFNFTCLDVCPVTIGDNVLFGPNVSLLTPKHPLQWQQRNLFQRADGTWTDWEYGAPITIGDNCWLGGNVVVCGGVTIGEGCVIGAGSVVTRNIPANSFAAGVPCRVIRPITDADRMELPEEL